MSLEHEKDEVFLSLLEPFGIKRYCTDGELMNGIFQLSFNEIGNGKTRELSQASEAGLRILVTGAHLLL